MPRCNVVRTQDGVAFVCGRGHRPKPCFVVHCREEGVKLCDFPIGSGRTCDRPCCLRHSRPVAGQVDRDHCLEHAFRPRANQ